MSAKKSKKPSVSADAQTQAKQAERTKPTDGISDDTRVVYAEEPNPHDG